MAILRYKAFSTTPEGGNPAGVVLDASDLDDKDMQQIAKEVGFSETAFLIDNGARGLAVCYFSPQKEVDFCGHATIAAACAYADAHEHGTLTFQTKTEGPVTVTTQKGPGGIASATFVSPPPSTDPLAPADLAALCGALRWRVHDLDPALLPPCVAYAGARHPIIAAGTRERLADLDYDFDALADLCERKQWDTICLVWRETPLQFHARNPFPAGGVREDPATGAAAAALAGYLAGRELVPVPADITVLQGHDMGSPSTITAHISRNFTDGIAVTGAAVPM
ncbi:PhzF family phenazine biosynthesis protein [Streptomyces nanshensis]|uniref:Phenazine biosynthesis protein PhzF n=1 Tax=Streptomyces nanshensis TaxID=518642 RepID=A0A1E7KZ76_9ACTN|nr:PhzF family phenazine biosynthesis isomerase [Streptomyces nanshensis]OEV09236.1 phenazine biosynthesis protein PhzF [Streptomyces nanshensis]